MQGQGEHVFGFGFGALQGPKKKVLGPRGCCLEALGMMCVPASGGPEGPPETGVVGPRGWCWDGF